MGVRGCRVRAGSAVGGRKRAAGSCRVSMAGSGEPLQPRKHCLGLEQGSRLTQRGGTKRWPWEEEEDETEILHRQMPGRAAGREHTTVLWAELQRTPCPSPAKQGHSPQWVCFSICARRYFTACLADGNRSHPSVRAAATTPFAEFWLLFGRAIQLSPPPYVALTGLHFLLFPLGASLSKLNLKLLRSPVPPQLPPAQPAVSAPGWAPLAGSTQSGQPLSVPILHPLISPGEELRRRKWETTAVRGGETGSSGINSSIAGSFSQNTNLE